ncbi:MAG: GNAT family N-acetyltransferase [Candidatus Pacebacteria bacterium]|nr:GNAT family N-acetyltransferase [Candidatus Paceibacterota bacterium]
MKIIIQKAKVENSKEIRELEKKIWKEECTNQYDMPMFIRFGYVFIAKDNLKIIGAVTSFKTNKNEVYVSDLFVDSKYRKLGIGQKLKERLLKEVKGMNVISFLDPKNTATINLHKKIGSKIVSKIKNAYGLKEKSLETGDRLLVRTKN